MNSWIYAHLNQSAKAWPYYRPFGEVYAAYAKAGCTLYNFQPWGL